MKPAALALTVALFGALWGSDIAAQAAKATADDASKDRAPTIDSMWVDTLSGQRARVCVLAKATGDSVTKIELSLRGVAHQTTRRGFGTSEGCGPNALAFEVPLTPGPNLIEAVAYAANTPSQTARTEVRGYSTQRNQRLWILTVGIDRYPNPKDTLSYARADARAFAFALKARADSVFKDVRIDSLWDAAATPSAIRTRIESLVDKVGDDINEGDTFVFFFAGHGTVASVTETSPKNFYLVGAGVEDIEQGLAVARGGISPGNLEEWLNYLPKSVNRLVVLDACQSGSVVEHFSKGGLAIPLMRAGFLPETVILTAVGPSEPAVELREIRHGLFTRALLNALADSSDTPEVRGVYFLAEEAGNQVASLYRIYNHVVPRKPRILTTSESFDLIFR